MYICEYNYSTKSGASNRVATNSVTLSSGNDWQAPGSVRYLETAELDHTVNVSVSTSGCFQLPFLSNIFGQHWSNILIRKMCKFWFNCIFVFCFLTSREYKYIFEMFVKKTKKDVLCFRLQFICLTCKIVQLFSLRLRPSSRMSWVTLFWQLNFPPKWIGKRRFKKEVGGLNRGRENSRFSKHYLRTSRKYRKSLAIS